MSSTHPGNIALAAYERARRAKHRYKQLVCKSCGLAFTAVLRDARFCSAACRQRAHRQRVG
jgi:protein-arginine kinase activator protein McsA